MAWHIVVDGVDAGGKTPLVNAIREYLVASSNKVVSLNPYRVEETYHLWKDDPVRAALIISSIMKGFIAAHPGADVFVWDRGWPTTFVCTENEEAHALFDFMDPKLTVFLLNSEKNTKEKREKYDLKNIPWYSDEMIAFYNKAYSDLARTTEKPSYSVIADGRYDIEAEVKKISKILERNLS